MPARHISSQSFDEILSDLGDDPAIPDPHGIRKPPQPSSHPRKPSQSNQHSLLDSHNKIQIPSSLQKMGMLTIFAALIIVVVIAFFTIYNALSSKLTISLEESQQQISELKKEFKLIQDEFHQNQDDLYLSIEEIEVSIHSLKDKKPENTISNTPKAPSHEAELRRWRYLVATQMGNSHQAFFHTGKSNLALEKGAQVLGEWRLSNIENGIATFMHPQGKSLFLKAFKSE